jgi:hypothetical protein
MKKYLVLKNDRFLNYIRCPNVLASAFHSFFIATITNPINSKLIEEMVKPSGIESLGKEKFSLTFVASIASSQTTASLNLSSSVFQEGKPIPAKYTCGSSNVSPPLTWSGFPKNTKSFAIIMDDRDAPMGTWVHW